MSDQTSPFAVGQTKALAPQVTFEATAAAIENGSWAIRGKASILVPEDTTQADVMPVNKGGAVEKYLIPYSGKESKTIILPRVWPFTDGESGTEYFLIIDDIEVVA